jgi:tetratricopeptide (TPR) repeat protein
MTTHCGADDFPRRIGELLEKASCHQKDCRFGDADLLVAEARLLATGNVQASAEIDLFCAHALLEQGKREQALHSLASMLIEYREWLKSTDGRAVYELVQIHRAFSLMHLQRNLEARPLLEEATDFQLDAEVRSNVHCHLGRCYHELSLYLLARKQFEYANALGISEEWQAVFRYYYGYSLYELKEFQRAKREFILCLQSGPLGPEPALRYSMLAATSRRLGEYSEAKAYEEQAKSLKP